MKIKKNGQLIRLTESDLKRIVKRVLTEDKYSVLDPGQSEYYDEMQKNAPDDEDFFVGQKRREDEYYKWERFKEIDKYNSMDEFYDDMEKNAPDDEDFRVRQKRREEEYFEWKDYLRYFKNKNIKK